MNFKNRTSVAVIPAAQAAYRANGRMRGSFVYLLLCQNPEGIYVKIGRSDDPVKRLPGILTGCPLSPGIMAVAELPNRDRALRLEQELHGAMRRWRKAREWFLFLPDDKAEFNQRLRSVADEFASPSWPIQWNKLSVPELIHQARRRKTAWVRAKQRRMAKDDMRRAVKSLAAK